MFSKQYLRSRSTVACRQSGGFCEPMFGCLLNNGIVAGSCNGFLTVCCAQPTTNSQIVSFEDNTFGSGANGFSGSSNPTSLSTSASSFR